MIDVFVVASVKQQEGLIEDGVANDAKSLGRKSDTKFNAIFDLAANLFCKNVEWVTNLRRLSFRTMATRLPFMYVDKLHDKSNVTPWMTKNPSC